MLETPTSMAIAALASAVMSFVLAFVMWTALHPTPAKPARPKALTLRISNIPTKITKEEFKEVLANAAKKMSFSSGPASEPLLGWSFARSGHSDRFSVGTATFGIPPAPSQLEAAIKGALGEGSTYLRVDLDFFGITPLADPPGAEVE